MLTSLRVLLTPPFCTNLVARDDDGGCMYFVRKGYLFGSLGRDDDDECLPDVSETTMRQSPIMAKSVIVCVCVCVCVWSCCTSD